jgi:hypothetical protein
MILRRLALITGALILLPLVIITAQPTTQRVRAFFGDCTMPCWQAIQVGKTTIEAATVFLDAHEWVNERTQYVVNARNDRGPYYYAWGWHDDQPFAPPEALFNARQSGGDIVIARELDHVFSLRLMSNLTFADVWLHFGDLRFSVYEAYGAGSGQMSISLIDTEHNLMMNIISECPYTLAHLWAQPVILTFTQAQIGMAGEALGLAGLSQWLRGVEDGQC